MTLLFGFVGLALFVYLARKVFYHFRYVKPGKLYRSGQLKNELCLGLVTLPLGINTLINLRSERECGNGTWYKRQKRACRFLGIEMIDIPIQEDVPPTESQIKRFCDIVDQPGRTTLVHCEYGIIRTGMMVVAYAQNSLSESPGRSTRHFASFGHRLRRHVDALAFVADYRPNPTT